MNIKLIWEYLEILAAAVGIPATRFLSTSPTGMNATGESDMVNYIEVLEAIQTMMFAPRLDILDTIIQKHCGLPEWEYEWNSLYPESRQESDKREKDVGDTLANLVEQGVITPDAAHKILIRKKIYCADDLGAVPTKPAAGASKISRPSEGDSSKPKPKT